MARLFTKQGMSAYIAKERVPYKPEIELRKIVFNIDEEHGYVCSVMHQKGKPSFDKVKEKSIYLYREEDEIYAAIFYDNSKSQIVNFTHCVKDSQKYQGFLNSIKWSESYNTDIPFNSELVKLVKYCISKWNYFVIFSKQPIPAKIFNHSKEHCELFGCWENEESTNPSSTPFYPQMLTEEDYKLIGKIVSNALEDGGISLNPTKSLTDFKKIFDFINSSEEKPEWSLVRVLVNSNQSVYSRQIDTYNQLFHKELDALIAEKKVTYLGEDMYKLPKVVSCEIDFEEFKERLIVTPMCNFHSIGGLVSQLWSKKHNLDVLDLKVDNYADIINDTILDAFYRDELFLHENYTGKNIEYGQYYDFFDHFYWHEVRAVLTKKGIRNFPDYQNVETLLKELREAEIAYEAENDGEKLTISLPQKKKKATWHSGARWIALKILIEEFQKIVGQEDHEILGTTALAKKVKNELEMQPKLNYLDPLKNISLENRNIAYVSKNKQFIYVPYHGEMRQGKVPQEMLEKCNIKIDCKNISKDFIESPDFFDNFMPYLKEKKFLYETKDDGKTIADLQTIENHIRPNMILADRKLEDLLNNPNFALLKKALNKTAIRNKKLKGIDNQPSILSYELSSLPSI